MTKKQKNKVNTYQQAKLRTREGLALRLWYDAKRRVSDPTHKVSGKYYGGLAICSKQEFLDHCLDSNIFSQLFHIWKDAKFARALRPTVERLDTKIGYVTSNMSFLPYLLNKTGSDRLVGERNILNVIYYAAGRIDEQFKKDTWKRCPYLLVAVVKRILKSNSAGF